jgi:hypothetical protein
LRYFGEPFGFVSERVERWCAGSGGGGGSSLGATIVEGAHVGDGSLVITFVAPAAPAAQAVAVTPHFTG